jgi:hypothetical protein
MVQDPAQPNKILAHRRAMMFSAGGCRHRTTSSSSINATGICGAANTAIASKLESLLTLHPLRISTHLIQFIRLSPYF